MDDRSAPATGTGTADVAAWSRRRSRDQSQRDYFPRGVGLALGAIAVGSVLYTSGAGWAWWVLLLLNAFAWPHIAYVLARRSADPERFEHANLMLDSVFVGVWVAVMQFNLLVSGLIAGMVWMDNMAVGAERFFLKGLAATALGVAVGILLVGPGWAPEPTLLQTVCSLPMLLIYPQLIGLWDNRITRRLNEKRRTLEKLSQLDGLSGLNNRQYWEYLARAEFNRVRRRDLRCSMVLLDIDRFKEFNDTHGHIAGDAVIRTVGRVLHAHTRREDPIGRYGGEEFALILTDADAQAALAKAEDIRAAIHRESRDRHAITISAGVAELTADLDDLSTWIERADEALYRAKHRGRNRVEVWQEPCGAATTGRDKPATGIR